MPCPRWEDLSPLHQQLREEVEEAILKYIKGEGVPPIILNAPYGSGKTTLLRHLLCFSLKEGIPAVKVNLSAIVKSLEGTDTRIPEDQFPQRVEEFFRTTVETILQCLTYKQCAEEIQKIIDEYKSCCNVNENELITIFQKVNKGILLIDEIEESYDALRQKIQFGTTPLRGLFDEVREGRLQVYTVLAFGPSSIYMEAISHAATWRVQIKTLPLVSPPHLKKFGISDPYLQNLLWWIGKGRLGHINRLKTEGIDQKALEALRECGEPDFSSLIGQKIVEDISYVDMSNYRSKLRELADEEERKLFIYLSLQPGPVPVGKITCLQDLNKLIKRRLSSIFVKENNLIAIDDVIKKLEEYIETDTTFHPFAVEIVRNVLLAWSDHNYLIFNRDGLRTLFEIIKDIAIELQQNELFELLNTIDLDVFLNDLAKMKKQVESYYIALSPSTLNEIYPLLVLSPLVRCSKTKKPQEIYSYITNYLLENLDNIYKISEITKNFLMPIRKERDLLREKLEINKYYILVVPVSVLKLDQTIKKLKSILLEKNIHSIILLPLAIDSQDLSMLSISLQKYINLGLVNIVPLSPRLSLFLLGFIYNPLIECREPHTELEARVLEIYRNTIRGLIERALNEAKGRDPSYLLIDHQKFRNLQKIWRRRGSEVGSEHGEYLLRIATIADQESEEQLFETLNAIKRIREEWDKLAKKLEFLGLHVNEITRGVAQLLENGERYYQNLKAAAQEAIGGIKQDLIDAMLDLLQEEYSERVIDEKEEEELREGVEEEILPKITLGISSEEYKYLLSSILLSKLNIKIKMNMNNFIEFREIIEKTEEIEYSIADLNEKLRKLQLQNTDIAKLLSEIGNQISILHKTFIEFEETFIKRYCNVETEVEFNKYVITSYICKKITANIIENLQKEINNLKNIIENLEGISNHLETLWEEVERCQCSEGIKEETKSYIVQDLWEIFKANNINELTKTLETFKDILLDTLNRFKTIKLEDELINLNRKIDKLHRELGLYA